MKDRKQLQASAINDFHTAELRFERVRAAGRGEETRHLDAELAKVRTMTV